MSLSSKDGGQPEKERALFISVMMILLSSGWAANHFSALVVVFKEDQIVSEVMVNAAFGVYAVGLVPCLLGGGAMADYIGARATVILGACGAIIGNLSLMCWHDEYGLIVGRLIVGLGVGLVVSAGTVWAGQLRGRNGSILAGIFLTLGFAIGPIASGTISVLAVGGMGARIVLSFAISAIVSGVAIVVNLVSSNSRKHGEYLNSSDMSCCPRSMSLAKSLIVSLPLAIWVFSCMTIAFNFLAGRLSGQISIGALLPGITGLFSFGAALFAQALGRRRGWGSIYGVFGTLSAAIGLMVVAVSGSSPTIAMIVTSCIFLGTAYGICLQQGLIDIDSLCPVDRRGRAIGVFYVFAYLGFAVPTTLDFVIPFFGVTVSFVTLSAIAITSGIVRGLQIKFGYTSA